MSTQVSQPHGSDNADLYGGIVLGVATIAALIVANSPLGHQYEALLQATGEVRIGSIGLSKSLEHWINDGLMAIFFLLVGLEIKREAVEGALASVRQAALPIIAAIGGFIVPAAIYAAVNWGDAQALRGWAVPAATDIAFALGVCAVLGPRVPPSLKTFLLALAIIDDLMAIIVIAIFYTDNLSVTALALGGVGVAALVALNRLDVQKPALYLIVGLFTWVCVLKSGVHATLAGVAVGLAMPLTKHGGHSLLEDTEHALKPWVSFAIVPVFAFANAGVPLAGLTFSNLCRADPARDHRRPVHRQAGRCLRRVAARHQVRRCRDAGRGNGRQAIWNSDAHRHRLHHEPVHRNAGLRRRSGLDAGPARRTGGFAALQCRRLGPAHRQIRTAERCLSSQPATLRIGSVSRKSRARRTCFSRRIALGLLLSLCISNLALAKDNGDDEEDTARPALPNIYLDMRTIYTTLPAGALSIGFSTPPLLSTLSNLSSIATLTSPSSRSIAVDLPVTVDVNDRLSVYGGISGSTSQSGVDPWTAFTVSSFTLGFQADIYQQNGGLFPTITIQSNMTRSIPAAPLATTTYNTILEADFALNADETRGLLAGVQYTRVLVDTPLASVKPDTMGYVGGYYQWDNNWKVTGRFGVQSFGGAQLLNLTSFQPFTQPIVRFDLDRMDDNDNRLFGVTAQIAWTPKPSYQLTLRTPLYAIRN